MLGSSISNYAVDAINDFLLKIRKVMNRHDRLLLGVDSIYKDSDTIIKAYDDSAGWLHYSKYSIFNFIILFVRTAKFNINTILTFDEATNA